MDEKRSVSAIERPSRFAGLLDGNVRPEEEEEGESRATQALSAELTTCVCGDVLVQVLYNGQ
jgi:hypothetical protein